MVLIATDSYLLSKFPNTQSILSIVPAKNKQIRQNPEITNYDVAASELSYPRCSIIDAYACRARKKALSLTIPAFAGTSLRLTIDYFFFLLVGQVATLPVWISLCSTQNAEHSTNSGRRVMDIYLYFARLSPFRFV
jgi:hypothetical protein